MDTISPGLDEPLVRSIGIAWKWPRLSRRFWAGLCLVVLFAAVAAWRLAICFGSVLACMR